MLDTPSKDLVGSLERGLAVMEILAAHPAGLTLTQMAELAGLTRSGARRFLLTLVASGYAVQSGRTFSLTPRLLTVARTWLQGAPLWTNAEPFLRAVSEKLAESCSAAVLSGEDIVYVARVASRRILGETLNVGTHLPAWCTSMGRVLLSDLPQPDLRAFLANASIVPRTARSIVDPDRLVAEIARAAEQGFAIVDEELETGLRSIAVPVRDRSGRIVAAINVSTQAARLSVAEMEREFLPPLRRAAHSIEDLLAVN